MHHYDDENGFGPNDIPVDAWFSVGEYGIDWFCKLLKKIFSTRWVSDEWLGG